MNHVPKKDMNVKRRRYAAPTNVKQSSLRDLLESSGRTVPTDKQMQMLQSGKPDRDVTIYSSGDLDLIKQRSVSIVGTRDVSGEGYKRARRLARELGDAGVVVVSGLAKGVDTAAHTSAIESGHPTIAVIGTPLEKAYPAENSSLQEWIYNEFLLLSPFAPGEAVFKGNFPKRNRVMAALSDATVIVEASDTSGTLHQAVECQRLGRWLFIMKSVAEDRRLAWPSSFLGKDMVEVLSSTNDIVDAIARQ